MINFFYKKMIRNEMSNNLKNFVFSKINNNNDEVINELSSIKYLLESIMQEINNDELKFQIKQKLNILSDIAIIFKKIYNEFTEIENSKKKDEEKIRNLYKEYFCVKIENEALEFKNENLIQKEKEYELLKEKTGAIFCNGKIICNERKDNEIIILRTENSLLKNEIKKIEDLLLEKNNIINHLNEKIIKLNTKIENLQKNKEEKYPSFSNINININELKHDNYKYKLNSKDSAFVNTIEVFTSNKNINKKENSTNVFPSYKSNHKLMNKINKGKKQIIERNNYPKPNINDISTKKYISVNKSLFSSKIKNNTKEKEQIQTNKIRSNYLINSPINKKSEKFSIEEIYKIPTIPNKNVIIKSNKIHKKNNSGQFHENSLKKLIIHDKNHSVLTETKRYNNIFPGFRIRNKNKIKEQNSKKNNSLPSTIFHSLTKSTNKHKNNNNNVIIDYMTPYTTRVSLKKRNENIINDFIKDNSLNLMHSSLLNRTNEDKTLYNNY